MNGYSRMLIGALLPCVVGCGGGGAAAAIRTRAATDLTCDSSAIQIERSSSAPEAGPYYARGCGKRWRYVVACNVSGYCPSPQGLDVQSLLIKQATFDLTCSAELLTITELNGDTFGVSGCGKKVSYLIDCPSSSQCRAVQNTQSQ